MLTKIEDEMSDEDLMRLLGAPESAQPGEGDTSFPFGWNVLHEYDLPDLIR